MTNLVCCREGKELLRLLCGGLLPQSRRGSFFSPPDTEGGVLVYVTWEAVQKIAETLIQAGLLVCAIETLRHLKKK